MCTAHCCVAMAEAWGRGTLVSAWMVVVVAGQSLGCSDTFSDELVTKLVAENFGAGTLAVRLENEPNGYRFQVVCLAGPAGETRHYTHASLVVFHSVNASKAVYGQYEFECDLQGVNGAPLTWSSGFLGSFLGTSGADNRLVPLTRPPPYSLRPAVNCVACVNPAHSLGGSRANADPVSHCVAYRDFHSLGNDDYEAVYDEDQDYSTYGNANNCTTECHNGGTLVPDSCDCSCNGTVYTGDTCSLCGCLNGGTCNGSTCLCPHGYTGRLCESERCVVSCGKDMQPPNSNCTCAQCTLTCLNGGEPLNDSCSCDCKGSVVYGGETCNVCNCTNGGWCSGHACVCPSAYTGKFCEKPQCIVPCGRNKHPANNCSCAPCNLECLNGGILRDDICACDCSPSGVYWGSDCSVCRCMNDGVCVGNKCRCTSKFTGSFCGVCPLSCRSDEYVTRGCNCDTCSNKATGCRSCYRDNWWSSKVQCTECQDGYSLSAVSPGECVRGAPGHGCSSTCIAGIVAINVGTLIFACIATLVVCVLSRRRRRAYGYRRSF